MTSIKHSKLWFFSSVVVTGVFFASHCVAGESGQWSVGAKLNATTWTVNNELSGVESEATATRLGLAVKYQRGRFYGGWSLLGADFEFTDSAPTRPTGSITTLPTTISHTDSDLIVGYYVWPKVSLFLDLKGVSNEWDDGYKVEYSGLGYGISVVHALSPKWAVSGAFGLASMKIEVNGADVGDTVRSALEISMHYIVMPQFNINFGIKGQGQTDEYDAGLKQKHDLDAFVFGANLMF